MASRGAIGTRLPVRLRGVISTAGGGGADAGVNTINGLDGDVAITTALVSGVALAGPVPPNVGIGIHTAARAIYLPDATNNWALFTAAPSIIVNTVATLPDVTASLAGAQATVTNDGAGSGLYIATGTVGAAGESWLKVGP